MSAEIKLNERQQEAVDWAEGPLLVLAGPGTGKTQLLSSRVVRILTETDAAPETILCLTFSENGARNMRERLISIMGMEAAKVNIYTYHAFGKAILGAYRNYAEHFDRVLEDSVGDVERYKIVSEIQKKLPAMDILRGDSIKDILSTISEAKAARLTADDLEKIAKKNMEQSGQMAAEISPLLRRIIPRMRFDLALPIYEEILEVVARYSSPEEIAPRVKPLANEMLFLLNKVIEEQKQAEKPKLSPLSEWRNKYFEAVEPGKWRAKDAIKNKKLLSFSNVMRRYEETLARAGLYDYDDMIEEAIAALQKDEGFRLSQAERFQHILLDEFQDTNPSQAELVRLITDYEAPDVMAVGDDDQAIFEFQGASASNMRDFAEHYHAHVINLEKNYRSYNAIVETAKKVAEQIEGSFAKQTNVKKPLKAMRGADAGKVTRREFISADAEYYWVAEEIARLIKSGVPESEIAVIIPHHKEIIPLLPYLKEHPEIHVSYEKRDNLLLDPKMSQLFKLARFVNDLANEKPAAYRLQEILAFPFWGIPPVETIKAVQATWKDRRSALDYLTNSENEQIAEVANFIAALVLKSYDTPLELMVDYMTGASAIEVAGREFRSPFIQYYSGLGEYESFEFYENLAVVREQIKGYIRSETPKIADLVKLLDDFEEANIIISNTSPYRESADAVQILTVHGSKGLEFDYVFMMSVDSPSWGKAKGNNNKLSLPSNVVQIRHTGVTEDEQLRKLFVAMTRARDELIMTNSLRNFAGKSLPRLEYLGESEQEIDGKKIVVSPNLPSGSQEVQLQYTDIEESKKRTNLRDLWVAAYTKNSPDLRALELERAKNIRLSATDITTFVDVVYAGPMTLFQRKILYSPSEPSSVDMEYGNLVHAVFEKITKDGISDEAAMEIFQTEAEKAPLEADERKVLAERGAASLKIALDAFGQILRHPGARAEVNLGPEHLVLGGVPVTGKIDNMIIDDEARTIEIYDYKTSQYNTTKKQDKNASLYKYALQLTFYKMLLGASPTYRKYKVTAAHILFVTPNKDGEVRDEIYSWQDEDELLTLTSRIYELMTSLDFLDDPEFNIVPDRNKGVEDIKAFIQKIIGEGGTARPRIEMASGGGAARP